MSEALGQGRRPERTLSADRFELVLRERPDLPTFPGVLSRVLALTAEAGGRDDAKAPSRGAKLASVVGADVALTARILSLAGGAGEGSWSLAGAIEGLGADVVRSAALSAGVLAPGQGAEGGLDGEGFWRHCVAVSTAARDLARSLGGPVRPDLAAVCGLLHDLGKLALNTCVPKTYSRVLAATRRHMTDITDYERRFVGVDHSVAGRRLARCWGLGEAVEDVLWLAHQPAEALSASLSRPRRLLIGLVGLADTVARELGIGFSGNFLFPRTSEQLAGPLGVDAPALDQVRAALAEKVDRRLAPLRISDGPGGGRVLRDANAELGRLCQRLARRAEAMSAQAEAFDLFCRFAADLPPQAPVWEVLGRVAEAFSRAAGLSATPSRPAVAYAIGQDPAGVLAARYDGGPGAAWRMFAGGSAGQDAPPARGPSVREMLAGLLDDPDQMLEWAPVSTGEHWALTGGGQWVGGVLIPTGSDRAGALGPLAMAMGMALATVGARARAMRVGEQLAGASQVLATTRDALAEAKTLAVVGEMAAGAAHELNTPLAVISGRAQWMREKAQTDQDRKTWGLVAEQAQRVSDIVSDLMAYATGPEPSPGVVDIRDLLYEAAEVLASSGLGAKGGPPRADIKVGTDVPPAMVDRGQILWALQELLRNAAAAGEADARIRLAAEADEVNGAVLLTVQDNGPGMDQHTLASAFTPFFSAQRAGRRRGLGLPRAKRYVESNGGRLWVRTRVGEGTTVYVQLPRASP